jgi:hypothetical protein
MAFRQEQRGVELERIRACVVGGLPGAVRVIRFYSLANGVRFVFNLKLFDLNGERTAGEHPQQHRHGEGGP